MRSVMLGGSDLSTWSLLVVLVGIVGIADATTGNLWLGPVYFLVICLAAWTLGMVQAISLGTGCLGITYVVNRFELHSFGSASPQADMLLRLLFVLTAIALVTGARRLYLREWHLARTDLLTGALNRQAFFEALSQVQPSKRWTLIAYADLDGFKQINDICGHSEGDETLRGFATAVRGTIRAGDLFARVGGDEFVTYMEVNDECSAKAVAARLHAAMNTALVRPTVSARCSVGALIVPPGFCRGVDRLKIADRLMYEAKQQGAALLAATMTGEPTAIVRHVELKPAFSRVAASFTAPTGRAAA